MEFQPDKRINIGEMQLFVCMDCPWEAVSKSPPVHCQLPALCKISHSPARVARRYCLFVEFWAIQEALQEALLPAYCAHDPRKRDASLATNLSVNLQICVLLAHGGFRIKRWVAFVSVSVGDHSGHAYLPNLHVISIHFILCCVLAANISPSFMSSALSWKKTVLFFADKKNLFLSSPYELPTSSGTSMSALLAVLPTYFCYLTFKSGLTSKHRSHAIISRHDDDTEIAHCSFR